MLQLVVLVLVIICVVIICVIIICIIIAVNIRLITVLRGLSFNDDFVLKADRLEGMIGMQEVLREVALVAEAI